MATRFSWSKALRGDGRSPIDDFFGLEVDESAKQKRKGSPSPHTYNKWSRTPINQTVYISNSEIRVRGPKHRSHIGLMSVSADISYEQRLPETYDDFWSGDDTKDLLFNDTLEDAFVEEDFKSNSPKPKTPDRGHHEMPPYTDAGSPGLSTAGPSRNGWCSSSARWYSSSARASPANKTPTIVSTCRDILDGLRRDGARTVSRIDSERGRKKGGAGLKVLSSVSKHAQNVQERVNRFFIKKPAFSPPFLSGAAKSLQEKQAADAFSSALFSTDTSALRQSNKERGKSSEPPRRQAQTESIDMAQLSKSLKQKQVAKAAERPTEALQAPFGRITSSGSRRGSKNNEKPPKFTKSGTATSTTLGERPGSPDGTTSSSRIRRSSKSSRSTKKFPRRDSKREDGEGGAGEFQKSKSSTEKEGGGLLLKFKLKSSKEDRLQNLDLLRKEKEDPQNEGEGRADLRVPLGDLPRIREAWTRYDTNNSGDLEPWEAVEALADMGLKPRSQVEKTELMRLMEEVDDGDGGIDFGEFCALLVRVRLRLQESLRAELAQAFLEHDEENSGSLNASEIMSVIEQLGFLSLCHSPHDPDRAKREVAAEINEFTQDDTVEADFAAFESLVQRVREMMHRMRRDREWELSQQYSFPYELFQQSRHEIIDLYTAFVNFDADGSGELDHQEIVAMLAQFGVLPRASAAPQNEGKRQQQRRKSRREEHHDVLAEVLEDIKEPGDDDSGDLDFRQYVLLVQRLRERAMEDRRELLYEVFRHYDQDCSGELSMSEVSKVLEDLGLSPRTRDELEEIQQLYEDVDKDGSQTLDFDEFAFLCARVSEKLRAMQREKEKILAKQLNFSDKELEDLHTAFETLDTNGNEGLTINDVRKALEMMRCHIDGDELRETFKRLDHDHTGLLDFGGWLRLMRIIEDQIALDAAAERAGQGGAARPTEVQPARDRPRLTQNLERDIIKPGVGGRQTQVQFRSSSPSGNSTG